MTYLKGEDSHLFGDGQLRMDREVDSCVLREEGWEVGQWFGIDGRLKIKEGL